VLPAEAPALEDIRAAARRIAPYAHATSAPLLQAVRWTSGRAAAPAQVRKLPAGGGVQVPGACNAVFSLSEEEAARGSSPIRRETTPRPWPWRPGCGGCPRISSCPARPPR
jgi:hypothetical protein